MSYSKALVILANSRKPGGRCIAGRELAEGQFGEWLRPIGARETEEVVFSERRFENNTEPQLRDIVQMQFAEHRPHSCQTENHLIDTGYRWRRMGQVSTIDLAAAIENPETLWSNGDSSNRGTNDVIREDIAAQLTSSLCLIRPERASIEIKIKFDGGTQVRCGFVYEEDPYNFVITDPIWEQRYRDLPRDEQQELPNDILLCVSISEPLGGSRYKLVAGIIQL